METQPINNDTTLPNPDLWQMCNQAQLTRFTNNYQGKIIVIGFNRYEILSGFMDRHVPHVELLQVTENGKPRAWHSVLLSLVDNTYENYSAYGETGRLKLCKKLGINPNEVH